MISQARKSLSHGEDEVKDLEWVCVLVSFRVKIPNQRPMSGVSVGMGWRSRSERPKETSRPCR